ncbi:hypothetical protein [Amycolatopsis sp. A1MSW2902]|uniref:hypothetical protein n=1 Tax=Amycolatopsis sp. A1MSW2902 TaxID=687413 RepID=UPI00307DF595
MTAMHFPGDAIPFADRAIPAPPSPGPDPAVLRLLAGHAARRAATLLAGGLADDPDPLVDLVCLLAENPPASPVEEITERAGIRPSELRRLRFAHTFGQFHGVRTALHAFDPPPQAMQRAVDDIAARHSLRGATAEIHRNWITYAAAQVQVRLGTYGHWYPFTHSATGEWYPARGHSFVPAEAYAAAIAARNRRQ